MVCAVFARSYSSGVVTLSDGDLVDVRAAVRGGRGGADRVGTGVEVHGERDRAPGVPAAGAVERRSGCPTVPLTAMSMGRLVVLPLAKRTVAVAAPACAAVT